MRYIHYHIKPLPDGTPYLFVIQYHYDCEVIVITEVGIHPIVNGHAFQNICADDQVISDEIYNHAISMLNDDGIC
jgi:hypothetical protein